VYRIELPRIVAIAIATVFYRQLGCFILASETRSEVTDMNKENDHDHEIHTYEYSGIQERPGKVNAWLIVVYVALLIWGAWYLITFWNHA
jgi:hypothetical protein